MNYLFYRFKWVLYGYCESIKNRIALYGSNKKDFIFCIGLNKSGTTSWTKAVEELGYVVGSENRLMDYADDVFNGSFDRLFKVINLSGNAFQDIPFSLPNSFIHLQKKFPTAKFIYTTRDDPYQWADSLTNFHKKLFFTKIDEIDIKMVKGCSYYKKGFLYKLLTRAYAMNPNALYDREALAFFYKEHTNKINEYFKNTSTPFISINVSRPADYLKMCEFLDCKPLRESFPWVNRT